ncbi:sucrose-6-phosphate hydrolase [Plectosphaerella plurivora]|uniref:beta-fructofuranosidase n=1 Tax=Plectosphaerella plurivora TaxID=936078 RepID=A0A9P8VIG5_9PEZI|nr:sucrose-6-phosphate hydrolase [Plectosphaerella plurivora]
MSVTSQGLFKMVLMAVAASDVLAGSVLEDRAAGGKLVNLSFETGDLRGWEVIDGDAFGNNSVVDWDVHGNGDRFNPDGKYFVMGRENAGEHAVGRLRSASFRAEKHMSFLISGGYDPERLFVALVRASDDAVLLKQTGSNDIAFVRIVWDTSAWAGEKVYVLLHDSSTAGDWGHIAFDDLRIGRDALRQGKGMTFNVIGQANQPEAGSGDACSLYTQDPLRPQYHYTPYQGWINDPAGLAQWKGKHHLFSQYYPDSPFWGPMHWAHAESTDAVHWRELPVALYPKETSVAGDESGRFTGSAMVHDDQLHLVFTEFTDPEVWPNATRETIEVASSSDGVHFELYPNNPVVNGPPEGESPFFRDPKVFHDPTDDSWKLVVGATNEQVGQVRLLRSEDGGPFDWSHAGVVFQGDERVSAHWECPNFFPIEDKWVLFYGASSLGIYEVGSYNGSIFTSEKRGLLEAGPASYAMQWYKDESGRNLAITWMANWDMRRFPTRSNGWAGIQSITRELFLREDGGLGHRPIAELDSLTSGRVKKHGAFKIKQKARSLGSSNSARVKVSVDLVATDAAEFIVSVFESAAEATLLTYNVATRTLKLDTTRGGYGESGTWEAVIGQEGEKKLDLDIFLDKSVLEVFVGDGTLFSATVFPRYKESTGISVKAGGVGTVAVQAASVTPLGSSWC